MAQWVLLYPFGQPWAAGDFFRVRIERFPDKFVRAEPDSECHGKDNSTKKNAEGKLNNTRRNPQVLESHGERQHNYEPLHANTEETGVVKIQVNGPNEHAPCKKAGDSIADQQNQTSGKNIGNIREDTLHKQIGPF